MKVCFPHEDLVGPREARFQIRSLSALQPIDPHAGANRYGAN